MPFRSGTSLSKTLFSSEPKLDRFQCALVKFTLQHASETYTAPVKDWPGIFWSHRHSDDALATRVTIDIDTATADTITTTLWIGHQAPNLTQVRHTFRRSGTTWKLVEREDRPEIPIGWLAWNRWI